MIRVYERSFGIARHVGGAHSRRGHAHAHGGAALPAATVFCSKPRE